MFSSIFACHCSLHLAGYIITFGLKLVFAGQFARIGLSTWLNDGRGTRNGSSALDLFQASLSRERWIASCKVRTIASQSLLTTSIYRAFSRPLVRLFHCWCVHLMPVCDIDLFPSCTHDRCIADFVLLHPTADVLAQLQPVADLCIDYYEIQQIWNTSRTIYVSEVISTVLRRFSAHLTLLERAIVVDVCLSLCHSIRLSVRLSIKRVHHDKMK